MPIRSRKTEGVAMIIFVLGMFVGASLGVLGVAMCVGARNADAGSRDVPDYGWMRESAAQHFHRPELDKVALG
jgi:hypothetical protein